MSEILKDRVAELLEKANQWSPEEMLDLLCSLFPSRVTFSTSFSYEDQVITHQIATKELPVRFFTLDTGRLFPETYSVWSRTLEKYNVRIEPYYPNQNSIQSFVAEKGPNSFYESVDNRKSCCHIRKVEPLQRALQGMAVWITGLRSEHSANRHDMPIVEWDEVNQVIKYHPILHWSTEDVKEYVQQHNIPYNILHDRGFVSIGCAPCTRAIRPGEDFRAGRWWWEDNSKKECGLHVHSNQLQQA
jgi:phosphoadenosine phosphosulfate reductase